MQHHYVSKLNILQNFGACHSLTATPQIIRRIDTLINHLILINLGIQLARPVLHRQGNISAPTFLSFPSSWRR